MFGFKGAKREDFAREDFAEVLEEVSSRELEVEGGDAETKMRPAQVQQPHDWLLQMLSGMMPAAEQEAVASKRADYEATYLEDAVAPLLEAIVSCEQDAIAEELGLHENLNADELHRLRRTFARENHPDRLHPSQRDLATHRMTIANMLIDRELRSRAAVK